RRRPDRRSRSAHSLFEYLCVSVSPWFALVCALMASQYSPMSRLYDLQNFCRGEREWLIETIEALVRLESPTTDKAAVDRCGAELTARLAAIGGRVSPLPRIDRGDHLLAEFGCGKSSGSSSFRMSPAACRSTSAKFRAAHGPTSSPKRRVPSSMFARRPPTPLAASRPPFAGCRRSTNERPSPCGEVWI